MRERWPRRWKRGSGGNAGTAGSSRDGSVDAATDGASGTIDAGSAGQSSARTERPSIVRSGSWYGRTSSTRRRPDSSNWGYEKGFVRNSELQWYQPDNANGVGRTAHHRRAEATSLEPQLQGGQHRLEAESPIRPVHVDLNDDLGKEELPIWPVRAGGQIDTRQGSWPAFWILGNGLSWPASGEVDNHGVLRQWRCVPISATLGGNCDWFGRVSQSLSSLGGTTWSNKFHLWAMEWDSQQINLYLDDKLVYGYTITSTNPYTGNPFYILVNLAIGANGGDPRARRSRSPTWWTTCASTRSPDRDFRSTHSSPRGIASRPMLSVSLWRR